MWLAANAGRNDTCLPSYRFDVAQGLPIDADAVTESVDVFNTGRQRLWVEGDAVVPVEPSRCSKSARRLEPCGGKDMTDVQGEARFRLHGNGRAIPGHASDARVTDKAQRQRRPCREQCL